MLLMLQYEPIQADYAGVLRSVNDNSEDDDDDEKEADFVASIWSNGELRFFDLSSENI